MVLPVTTLQIIISKLKFMDIDFLNNFLSDPKNQFIFFILTVWSLIWKGFALWQSANNKQKNWFIAMLIINTFGILEIIYIFYFQTREGKEVEQK